MTLIKIFTTFNKELRVQINLKKPPEKTENYIE